MDATSPFCHNIVIDYRYRNFCFFIVPWKFSLIEIMKMIFIHTKINSKKQPINHIFNEYNRKNQQRD